MQLLHLQIVIITRWHQVCSTKQVTEQFCTLSERFVTEFVFGNAAESKLETFQPQFGDLSVHHLVVLFNVVVVVPYLPIHFRTFNEISSSKLSDLQ